MRPFAFLKLLIAGFLLGTAFLVALPCRAETMVTITKRAPMEALSPTGDIIGVSEAQSGATYFLVTSKNDQVVLKDITGNQYEIAITATDYVAPPVSAKSVAVQPASTPSLTSIAAPTTPTKPTSFSATNAPANLPVRAVVSASTSVAKPSALTFTDVNTAFGKPFFSDQPVWSETTLLMAQRVGLGLEGRTQWEASYRRYFSGQPDDPKSIILGSGAYCIAIYADAQDHPTSMLIAFANDGDFHGQGRLAADLEGLSHSLRTSKEDLSAIKNEYRNKWAEVQASFEPVRIQQQGSLTDKLTALFGTPQSVSFGSDPTTKEDALRWDWNGASFLLTCQNEKYNLLRIIPTELADSGGHAPRISRDDIGHRLSGAVEHRDNGDAVITQLPMADQGYKGYCVPATWERVLRYTGVPGDMYTLSRIGHAHFGGGENGLNVAQQLDKTLYDYGRHVEVLRPTHLDYIAIRHYIDDGVPIFWGVNPNGYDGAEQRYSLCDRSKDFDTWKKLLDQARATPDKSPPAPDENGHQVLIIGYNPNTKEIAWTDPWGRETKERWMTQEEAVRCTLNQYYVITW